MKQLFLIITLFFCFTAVTKSESPYPVRGLCIAAPNVDGVDEFVKFIDEDLATSGLNLLILRVDWGFEYQSHPELRSNNPLKMSDVKKLVEICRKNNIRLIPQINLFGHQSWASTPGKLLEVYPQFDETPKVKFPEKY